MKRNENIHVVALRIWDINMADVLRYGCNLLKNDKGITQNKKIVINIAETLINKGKSSSDALVTPQKNIVQRRIIPAIKKSNTAKLFNTPGILFMR